MEEIYSKIYEQINNFKPTNDAQKENKEFMLWCMNSMPDLLTTKNDQFHFTASAFIVNQKHNKVLAVYNNISDSWSIVGGHNDGLKNPLNVAIKEVKEETGIKELNILNNDEPISLEKILVNQHFKDNKLVYEHYHLNLTYLFEVDETLPLIINEQENSDIKWMNFDEFLDSVSEKSMIKIYKQIIKKI